MKNLVFNWIKRISCVSMATVMAASCLTGCQKKNTNGNDPTADLPDEVYHAEYHTLSGDDLEWNIVKFGLNEMYAFCNRYDEVEMSSVCKFVKLSLDDYSEQKSCNVTDDFLAHIEARTDLPADKEYERAVYASGAIVHDDESLSVLAMESYFVDFGDDYPEDYEPAEDDYKTFAYLVKYDSDFDFVSCTEINTKNTSGMGYGRMVGDAAGNVYIASENTINIFDEDMNFIKDVTIPSDWYSNFFEINGQVYVSYYDDSFNEIRKAVDASGNLTDCFEGFTEYVNGINDGGQENCFIAYNDDKVFLYNGETRECFDLFTWVSVDVNAYHVRNVYRNTDGVVYAQTYDWENGIQEIVKISLVSRDSVAVKKEIVLASLSEDYMLKNYVAAYNKAQSEYHITLKTYLDWSTGIEYEDAYNLFVNDITTGNNIDIVNMADLEFKKLANDGLFVDITDYVEKSAQLSLDSYNDSILNIYRADGKQYAIPYSFSLSSLAVNEKMYGSKEGWTVDHMIEYSEKYPDALLMDFVNKEAMEQICITENMSQFIDWETGECRFDSDEFKHILEFIKTLPDSFDYDKYMSEYSGSRPEMVASGKLLAVETYIYDLRAIQEYNAYFGGNINYVGYPTVDGTPSCKITPDGAYGILSTSKESEGAWMFIEYLLTQEPGMDSFGLPTNKNMLQSMIDKELEGKGKKTGGTVWYDDDFSYEYHYSTKEEIDFFLHLLDIATPYEDYSDIMKIIEEETQSYYKGQKSVDDVTGIIQSRISMYVKEHM